MKDNVLRLCAINAVSHPSRGAWIESKFVKTLRADTGRTPHGVRGLKVMYSLALTPAVLCRTPHGVRGLKVYLRV